MRKQIPLFAVHMPRSVDEPLLKVLHSGYIGQGPKVEEFEAKLRSWIGAKHLVTLNNGTAGLHLALHLAGVGPSSEVVSTPMTCSASNTPILHTGARIRWADIDPQTGNIDPDSVLRLMTNKTRAIVCVDWGGYPCLVFGTTVITKLGSLIRKQKIGELADDFPEYVLGRNEVGPCWSRVRGVTKRHYRGDLIRVRVGNAQIVATPNHPFYTRERGWIPASKISAGQQLSYCDTISYGENNDKVDRGSDSIIEGCLSNGRFGGRYYEVLPDVHLDTSKVQGPAAWSEDKKPSLVRATAQSNQSNERCGPGLHSGDYRWGRDNLSCPLQQGQHVYSVFGNIQHERGASGLHCQNNRILSPGWLPPSTPNTQAELRDSLEKFPSRKITRAVHSVSSDKKEAGRTSFGLLLSSPREPHWDQAVPRGPHGYPKNSGTKWDRVSSVEIIAGDCLVYDLITSTKNFFANGYLVHNCDLDELRDIADAYGVPIIEDAAHAFGAEHKERRIGTISDYTMFSLQAIKHINTVDGGVLCMRDPGHLRRAKLLRWYGIDREAKASDLRCEADVAEGGWKYHMNDIAAVIGLEQMRHIDWILERHRANAAFILGEMKSRKVRRVRPLSYKKDRLSSYWLLSLLADDSHAFMRHMTAGGVQVSRVHSRNDTHSCFSAFREGELPGVDKFCCHQVSVPVHWALTSQDRWRIVNRIAEYESA